MKSLLQNFSSLNDPFPFVKYFFEAYPLASEQLLGNINKALNQRLLERKYGGDKSTIPIIDYLAVQGKAVPESLPGVARTKIGNSVTFKFGSKLPETGVLRLQLSKALHTLIMLYAVSLHLGLGRSL